MAKSARDEDLPRENDTKTSAVHFLRFELSDEMAAALKYGVSLAMGVDHPQYTARVDVSSEARAALVADLAYAAAVFRLGTSIVVKSLSPRPFDGLRIDRAVARAGAQQFRCISSLRKLGYRPPPVRQGFENFSICKHQHWRGDSSKKP